VIGRFLAFALPSRRDLERICQQAVAFISKNVKAKKGFEIWANFLAEAGVLVAIFPVLDAFVVHPAKTGQVNWV
jgi:hypothetical protein